MRIKKLLIAGALILTAFGCISAYTIYADTLSKNTNKEVSTTEEQKSTTEAKTKTEKSTKSSEDEESTDSKEETDDSEEENIDVDDNDVDESNNSTEDVDESEDVPDTYEVIQDGDENDAVCDHKWGAEQGGYDSEKGYFYWRECEECGQQKIDRYVSEEEYLKNDPDYQEPTTENKKDTSENIEVTTETTATEN